MPWRYAAQKSSVVDGTAGLRTSGSFFTAETQHIGASMTKAPSTRSNHRLSSMPTKPVEISTRDTQPSHSQNRDGMWAEMTISRPHLYWSQRTNPLLGLFCLKTLQRVMTAEECQRRAEEAKALAAQTQDLWERETLLRIATQWQPLASHRAVKEGKPAL